MDGMIQARFLRSTSMIFSIWFYLIYSIVLSFGGLLSRGYKTNLINGFYFETAQLPM